MSKVSKNLDSAPQSLQEQLDEIANFNVVNEATTPVERIHKIIQQLQALNARVEKLTTLLG